MRRVYPLTVSTLATAHKVPRNAIFGRHRGVMRLISPRSTTILTLFNLRLMSRGTIFNGARRGKGAEVGINGVHLHSSPSPSETVPIGRVAILRSIQTDRRRSVQTNNGRAVESAGIRIQRKCSGLGRWNHYLWSGSGGPTRLRPVARAWKASSLVLKPMSTYS